MVNDTCRLKKKNTLSILDRKLRDFVSFWMIHEAFVATLSEWNHNCATVGETQKTRLDNCRFAKIPFYPNKNPL